MAYLGKGRKEDLFILASELGLETNPGMAIIKLKEIITGSNDYDEEFTKNLHSSIVEERKNRQELEERRRQDADALEELKRKDEIELEKLRIQAGIKSPTEDATNNAKLPSRAQIMQISAEKIEEADPNQIENVEMKKEKIITDYKPEIIESRSPRRTKCYEYVCRSNEAILHSLISNIT